MIFQWANCPFRIDVIVRLHKLAIIPPEFAIRELQIFIIKWLNITIITDKNIANIFLGATQHVMEIQLP